MSSKRKILTKKEILLYFGLRSPKKKPNPARYLLYPLILLAFAPYFMLLYFLFSLGFQSNTLMYGESLMPLLVMSMLVIIHVFLLMNGMPALFARFYGNKDNIILFSMPVTGADIMISRSTPIFMMQAFLSLLIFIPFMVAALQSNAVNVHQWIHLIVGLITSIIFPTAISAVILVLLMRFTNLGRYSNGLKIIGFIGMMVMIIGIQFVIQSGSMQSQAMDAKSAIEMLANQRGLIESAATLFLPAKWTSLAFVQETGTAYIYTLLNILLSVLSVGLLVIVSQKYYLKAMLDGSEMAKSSSKKKKLDVSKSNIKPAYRSIFLTEWRLLKRTPAYFMNVLSIPIILPIMWLMPLFVYPGAVTEAKEIVRMVLDLQEGTRYIILGTVAVGFALSFFINMFNSTSTSVSREGQAFMLRRVLPLKAKDEILGRNMVNWMLVFFMPLMLFVIAYFVIGLPLWIGFFCAFFTLFFSVPLGFVGLLVDYTRPKLNWSDANQAVKQNMNSFFAILLNLAIFLIYALAGFILYKVIGLNLEILFYGGIIFIILNIILSIVSFIILKGTVEEKLQSLEM